MKLRSSLILLMATLCAILFVSCAVRTEPITDISSTASVGIPAEVATLVPTDIPDINATVDTRVGLRS